MLRKKQICPACMFEIEGTAVAVDGVSLHAGEVCLSMWLRRSPRWRRSRAAEAKSLEGGSWLRQPPTRGSYWARQRGCKVLRAVEVFDGPDGVRVRCGESERPLRLYNDFEFYPKAV